MPTYRKESSLLKPVLRNLRRRGFSRQRSEVQFYDYSMDIYAMSVTTNKTTAVELKLERWTRAFEQAIVYQLCADLVYIALPVESASRVEQQLLSNHGIGLIAVREGPRCDTLLPAKQSTVILPEYRDFYVSLMQGKPR